MPKITIYRDIQAQNLSLEGKLQTIQTEKTQQAIIDMPAGTEFVAYVGRGEMREQVKAFTTHLHGGGDWSVAFHGPKKA